MNILSHIAPERVFTHFEKICQIPHGSGNEKGLSDYIAAFAKSLGLRVYQDAVYNLIISKPATEGYQLIAPIILQGHIDMVCEKETSYAHDFMNDPIPLVIDGDWVCTRGTTLGADDGIAVAMCMAVMEATNLAHPPIEFLLTVSEETGMEGVRALDTSLLTGKRLLNIDEEAEGEFTTSCAGGVRAALHLEITTEPAPKDAQFMQISIQGLRGGHSGVEIHKERANAIRLLGRLLSDFDTPLVCVSGGAKDNAIARQATAIVVATAGLVERIQQWEVTLRHEFRVSDPDLEIVVTEVEAPATVMTKQSASNVANALLLLPNGIQSMSLDIAGLVETSSNMGVLTQTATTVEIVCAIRSAVTSRKQFVLQQIVKVAALVGGTVETYGDYPAWGYRPESPLRDLVCQVYETVSGQKPQISAIHAGLECGLLREKMPDVDMLAFGPTIDNAHTPQERLSISATKRVWALLIAVLAALS